MNNILFLGPQWRGSDARALAQNFRARGCAVIEVDYEDYFPIHWSSLALRILRRFIRPLCAHNYNSAVRSRAASHAFDFVVVFKGMMLFRTTLSQLTCPRYCVYPDISFLDHGPEIWRCLPVYDCVFTTKRFHLEDDSLRQHVRNLKFVPHGADPEVHRPLPVRSHYVTPYEADVSFVGCWSPKKEALIRAVVCALPTCRVRLWGPGWERASSEVRQAWEGRGVYGDELAIVYQASKVNLGLLSEAGSGTCRGDQTTARTWQIPACAAFLLHERTQELNNHFEEGTEIACFEGPSELVSKVGYYLSAQDEAAQLAKAGYQRCHREGYDSYAQAASTILEYHQSAALHRGDDVPLAVRTSASNVALRRT